MHLRAKRVAFAHARILLPLLASFLAVAAHASSRLAPKELIMLKFPRVWVRPHEDVEWRIYSVVPYGRSRYLAFGVGSIWGWDQWVDKTKLKQEARDKGVVTSYTPEIKNEPHLLVMDRYGKVIDEAKGPNGTVGYYTTCCSTPLVMESDPSCPLALFDAGSRKVACFDYELGRLEEHEVPIDDIDSAHVTFDGERYTVWVFGRGYGELQGERSQWRRPTTLSEIYSAKVTPATPATLGAKFYPSDGKVEPLPVNLDELVGRLERIARGPQGEKLKLQKASLRLFPFEDGSTDEPFKVLIQVLSADKYENQVELSGTWLYFRGTLDSLGLGKIEQIPLWIQQGTGRDSPDLDYDPETGVLRFPEFLWCHRVLAYAFSPSTFAVYMEIHYGRYKMGSDGVPWSYLAPLFLYFSGPHDPPEVLGFYQDGWLKDVADAFHDDNVSVLPVRLVGRTAKNDMIFAAYCEPRDGRGERKPCLVSMSLEVE